MPVVYQGATGQGGANGVQSAFPQIYIWTGSSVPPARPTTTSTYTWSTGAYTAPADWYTTAPSNTSTGNYLWSITIPLNVSATTTTSTLDWTDVAYPIRCIAYNGTNGNPGNAASAMFLNSSAQTFTYDSGGNANPASQTITFTANPQNIVGTTLFTATNYDVNNNPIGSPSLGGSGNTRTLAIADFGVADHCEVVASLSGYSDTVTVVKLQDGLNTTTGYLTNESVTVQTDSSGGGGVYTSAGGTFKVFNGTTDVTTSSAFTATPSTGLSLTINATTGVYTVTDLTVAQGTATLTAVYGGVTVTKVYTISKSYAGSVGSAGAATFVITRAANDSSTPTNAEVNTAIGRNPVPGDIVTISYNTGNNAVVYRCTNFNTGTGVATWVSQATYITGSLIVENTITASNIKANTITGTEINGSTLNVLGTVTAGELKLGIDPEISGTTMTGTGAHLYSDGRMVLGNATNNINWNGSTLTIAGDIVGYGNLNGTAIGQIIAGSFNFVTYISPLNTDITFTVPTDVYKLKVTCIGGGGGGSSGNGPYGGGGGGACLKTFAVTPGQTYTIRVGGGGNGGAAGNSGGNVGANGNASSFSGNGINMTGNGGTGAPVGGNRGGAGGSASGGILNYAGNYGGSSQFLGGGGAAAFIGIGSAFQLSGPSNSGAGGGGNYYTQGAGGNGGSGIVIVEY